MSKCYVYAHHRKSDGNLFYIGKGKRDRATSRKRNIYWKRVAEKHGFTVRFIKKDMNEQCALSLERALIAVHKPLLCNLTDGGEGTSGFCKPHSEETKRKIGDSNRRPKPEGFGEAVRVRLSGKSQPAERNHKRSVTMAGKHAGLNNPMHGKTGALAPNYDKTEYRLTHPEHGVRIGTTFDLEAAFGYRNGALRNVARGRTMRSFGWSLA